MVWPMGVLIAVMIARPHALAPSPHSVDSLSGDVVARGGVLDVQLVDAPLHVLDALVALRAVAVTLHQHLGRGAARRGAVADPLVHPRNVVGGWRLGVLVVLRLTMLPRLQGAG